MYSREHRPVKRSADSDSPTTNQFAPRPFVIQQKTEEVKPQQEQTPDSQAKTAEGKESHSNFPDKAVFTRHLTPPKIPRIQMKLTIGQSGDKYEQEADRVAANVVQQINDPQSPSVQRGQLPKEPEELQKKSFGDTRQREELSAEKGELHSLSSEDGMTATPVTVIHSTEYSPVSKAPIQRQLLLKGKPIENPEIAIQVLTGIAKKQGLDLDFSAYKTQVEALRTTLEQQEDLDSIRNDGSGFSIVRLFNQVSGLSLTPEAAPKLAIKPSDKEITQVQQPISTTKSKKKTEYSSLEELEKAGLIHSVGANQFQYYWGGTSKIDSYLRDIFPDQMVTKNVLESGLRELTVKEITFAEEVSPFPAAKNVQFDESQQKAIVALAEDYQIKSPEAMEFLKTLFIMNAAKGAQTKGIKRWITAFFETFIEELEDEGVSLDQTLRELQQAGMYSEIVKSGNPNEVIKSLFAMQGVDHVESNPKLLEIANSLAKNTDILRSSTWLAARTDEEYAGLIGEYISRLDIGNIMPTTPTEATGGNDKIMQLHSVHFIGDLFKKTENEPYRTDTDVCSELDLMSVVAHADKSFTCFALGNTKVTKSSKAAEARTQNEIAQKAMSAYSAKEFFNPDKDKKALVKKIYGFVIPSNDEIQLENIKLGSAPEQRTIGAKEATGEYSHSLSLTYNEVHTIALLLRERVSKER